MTALQNIFVLISASKKPKALILTAKKDHEYNGIKINKLD